MIWTDKHMSIYSYVSEKGDFPVDDTRQLTAEMQDCEAGHDHTEAVRRVSAQLPEDDILYDLADLFRIFADSTRIKILYALYESELCVGAITQLLGMTQSAVSHQLRALKQSKLVKYRREGKTIFYSLADEHVVTILAQGMEHIEE